MTKSVWGCGRAVCQGTGGGGCHGIPVCLCGGGGVILRVNCFHCLKMNMRKTRRKRFSSAFHFPVAHCQIHPLSGQHLVLKLSLEVHQRTAAPPQCLEMGSGVSLGSLVLSKKGWSVREEREKHHYGPQSAELHSSTLSWRKIHWSDLCEKQDLEYFSVFRRGSAAPHWPGGC